MHRRFTTILAGGTLIAAAAFAWLAPRAIAGDAPDLSDFESKPAAEKAPADAEPAKKQGDAAKSAPGNSSPSKTTANTAPPDADDGPPGTPTPGTPTAAIGPAGGREVTLAQMMVILNEEAKRVTKNPADVSVKDKPDFAKRRNLRVSESEIIRMLARKIHREPAVEAYVKWQLTSFEPDFTKATVDQMRGIIASMPAIVGQPQPSYESRNDAGLEMRSSFSKTTVTSPGKTAAVPQRTIVTEGVTFSTSGGVGPDERYLNVNVKASQAQLNELKQQALEINRIVFASRQRIIERIPRENGVQLGATLKDLADRIVAGDPTHDSAADKYVKACVAAAKPGSGVSRDMRELLAKETENVAQVRTFVIDKVKPAQGGGVETPGHDVQLSERDANAAITALRETK